MKTILIVDDSLAQRRLLERIIASSGEFQVVGCARNGAEAIRMNQEKDPDIICMDLNMPVMDGMAALRSLAVLDPAVRIILISSMGGVGDKFAEALKYGAHRVLAKPFDAASVLEALRSA